jgi:hypothetical protein
VGGVEARAPVFVEPSVGYHSFCAEVLTMIPESGFGTLSGGRFDWGGRLLKGNGGAQRFPQRGWKSRVECKGIRELNRETNKSIWYESRA